MIKIAPSILAADFSKLGEEVQKVEQGGADWLHIDVMDGQFVPNITMGPGIVKALRASSQLFFDVHLMIQHPERFIEDFIQAGADMITVHAEACTHLHRIIQQIRQQGCQAGVALNPSTPLAMVEEILTGVDMVLLMSVNPGFGGQQFIPEIVPKIRRLKQMMDRQQYHAEIEIDGGINDSTAGKVIEAGATVLVAGSAVYGQKDAVKAIAVLRAQSA